MCLSLAAGCRNPAHTAGDPLMGPVNPPGINGQQLPPTPTKAQTDATPVPTAQNSTTPAGMANNAQLPGGRPLTIGDALHGDSAGAGPNWQLTNTSKNTPGKTPIVQPVPRDPPPAPGGLQPSSWISTTNPAGAETELAKLKARGALGEHYENVVDGVHLTCFVRSRANPANLRQYEVTAADLAAAVQAILRQIDAGNQ